MQDFGINRISAAQPPRAEPIPIPLRLRTAFEGASGAVRLDLGDCWVCRVKELGLKA